MSIKEFAERFIKAEREAWQTGNFDKLAALEHKDIVFKFAGFPDTVGWEAHKQYIQGATKFVSDCKPEWEYLTGDGKVFAIRYKLCFKVAQENPMHLPIGKKVATDHIMVFQLKDGKIQIGWSNGTTKIK